MLRKNWILILGLTSLLIAAATEIAGNVADTKDDNHNMSESSHPDLRATTNSNTTDIQVSAETVKHIKESMDRIERGQMRIEDKLDEL